MQSITITFEKSKSITITIAFKYEQINYFSITGTSITSAPSLILGYAMIAKAFKFLFKSQLFEISLKCRIVKPQRNIEVIFKSEC